MLLAQDLALQELDRRLTTDEFTTLLIDSADLIIDGDDEDDNVYNSGIAYPRVDMLALAESILALDAGADTGADPDTGASRFSLWIEPVMSYPYLFTFV